MDFRVPLANTNVSLCFFSDDTASSSQNSNQSAIMPHGPYFLVFHAYQPPIMDDQFDPTQPQQRSSCSSDSSHFSAGIFLSFFFPRLSLHFFADLQELSPFRPPKFCTATLLRIGVSESKQTINCRIFFLFLDPKRRKDPKAAASNSSSGFSLSTSISNDPYISSEPDLVVCPTEQLHPASLLCTLASDLVSAVSFSPSNLTQIRRPCSHPPCQTPILPYF
jgi:hypothetical protein